MFWRPWRKNVKTRVGPGVQPSVRIADVGVAHNRKESTADNADHTEGKANVAQVNSFRVSAQKSIHVRLLVLCNRSQRLKISTGVPQGRLGL